LKRSLCHGYGNSGLEAFVAEVEADAAVAAAVVVALVSVAVVGAVDPSATSTFHRGAGGD
jgi:hypothetical protein